MTRLSSAVLMVISCLAVLVIEFVPVSTLGRSIHAFTALTKPYHKPSGFAQLYFVAATFATTATGVLAGGGWVPFKAQKSGRFYPTAAWRQPVKG